MAPHRRWTAALLFVDEPAYVENPARTLPTSVSPRSASPSRSSGFPSLLPRKITVDIRNVPQLFKSMGNVLNVVDLLPLGKVGTVLDLDLRLSAGLLAGLRPGL